METVDVETLEGPLRGIREPGLAIFRGIPFAEPPVGALRFKPPMPPKARQSVLESFSAAAVCPQLPSRLASIMGESPARADESCLTVDIWAPTPLDRPRPILVWIHGGGYLSGSGSLPWYDGSTLARENDIVVVGLNYRLGALGYLCLPGLIDGNMGLLDQIQAIRWITTHASAFGGDPRRITLMGQSGGAHSITCMLAMPETRKLMQRAILLSTPFALRTHSREDAASTARLFCTELGIDPDNPQALPQLQAIGIDRILQATGATLRSSKRAVGDPTPPFGPVATGGLPEAGELDEAVAQGAGHIDAIVGCTADETLAFYPLDPRLAALSFDTLPPIAQALFGGRWRDLIERARCTRPGATALEVLSEAQTANYFVEGIRAFATAVSRGTGAAWVYRFDWSPQSSPFGACHCIELPFVFGTFDAFQKAPMLGEVDERARLLSALVRKAIGGFVKDGTPGCDAHWPKFSAGEPALLQVDSRLRCGRLA
jgi:para-nitrobenzyl esterase